MKVEGWPVKKCERLERKVEVSRERVGEGWRVEE